MFNINRCFDPVIFEERFNNVLLPLVKKQLEGKGRKNREYVFRATFSEHDPANKEWSDIILNIEQVTFNLMHGTVFPRNLHRYGICLQCYVYIIIQCCI